MSIDWEWERGWATATNGSPVVEYSSKEMLELMRSLQPPRRTMFVTHPANAHYLEVVGDEARVLLSAFLPERKFEKRWTVPPGDKFITYEESDRAWMEPLGIGVSEIDLGPLIYEMEEPCGLEFIPES